MNNWTETEIKGEWRRNDAAFVTLMRLNDDFWMLHLPFETHPVRSLQAGMDLYEELRG